MGGEDFEDFVPKISGRSESSQMFVDERRMIIKRSGACIFLLDYVMAV